MEKTLLHNSGKDKQPKNSEGVPNTIGTYVKGLNEAKNNNQFNSRDDDEVRLYL